MASKYKNPSDVELVAIYRLEFYKKQKNWKFCQDVCKKKAQVLAPAPDESSKGSVKSVNSAKSVLNKTYNLDPELDPPDLNNAFLEPDPDKIPPVTPPDPINAPSVNTSHKTESNISHQKWPQTKQKTQDTEQKWPESQQKWPEQQQQWPVTEQQWPESEQQWPESELQWPEQEKKWVGPQSQWPEADRVWSVPEMPEQCWQNAGQEWGGEGAYYLQEVESLRAYETDRGWPEPCAEADIACVEEPWALLGAADAWLQPAARSDRDARSQSMESMISFMRGAAAAPHSSEVDLNVTGSSASQVSDRSAACLAPHALAAAVRSHAAALRLLLREARARDDAAQAHPRSTLSVDYRTPNAFNLTCEDRPTRDIDLFHPHNDSFIAGSFKNERAGRGRGRLHRERLIGIGMGRPYRL